MTGLETMTDGVPAAESCYWRGHALRRGVEPKLPEPSVRAKQNCTRIGQRSLMRGSKKIHTDTLQPSGRQGLGRLKHVEARLLAAQDWRQQGRIHAIAPAVSHFASAVITTGPRIPIKTAFNFLLSVSTLPSSVDQKGSAWRTSVW